MEAASGGRAGPADDDESDGGLGVGGFPQWVTGSASSPSGTDTSSHSYDSGSSDLPWDFEERWDAGGDDGDDLAFNHGSDDVDVEWSPALQLQQHAPEGEGEGEGEEEGEGLTDS
eukprot:COSAG06_NODE_29678_length_552_cov_0.777042_1_plen_114_part_10